MAAITIETDMRAAVGSGSTLADYCAECAAEPGCSRFDVIVEPDVIEWSGAAVLIARYRCGCGHQWTCRWSPDQLDLHGMKGQ